MPAESTRREISGQPLDVGLGDEARLGHDRVHDHDVEPGDVVDDEQAAAARGLALDAQGDAEQAQHLQRPPADPRQPLGRRQPGKAEQRRSPGRAAPCSDRAQQARGGAKAAATPRRRSRASASRLRAPASCATRPATRVQRTRPSSSLPANGVCRLRLRSARRVELPRDRRIEHAEVGRRARGAGRAGRSAAVRLERASTALGRLVTGAERLRQAEAARLAPLQRQPEQQLEPGRAGLGLGERQVLLVLGRPACGR